MLRLKNRLNNQTNNRYHYFPKDVTSLKIEDSNRYHGLFYHLWNCDPKILSQKVEFRWRNSEKQEQKLGNNGDQGRN